MVDFSFYVLNRCSGYGHMLGSWCSFLKWGSDKKLSCLRETNFTSAYTGVKRKFESFHVGGSLIDLPLYGIWNHSLEKGVLTIRQVLHYSPVLLCSVYFFRRSCIIRLRPISRSTTPSFTCSFFLISDSPQIFCYTSVPKTGSMCLSEFDGINTKYTVEVQTFKSLVCRLVKSTKRRCVPCDGVPSSHGTT